MSDKRKVMITLIITLVFLNAGMIGFALKKHGDKAREEAAEAARMTQTTQTTTEPATEPQPDPEEEAKKAASHVIAHRGTSGADLEHSLKAYDEAIAQGAYRIEQDVVVSRDGTLYASHDTSASRLTGVNRAFADMTDGEIDQLTTRAGEKILRLSEIFDRYGTDIEYVIELKDEGRGMVQPFADLIRQYGYEDRVTVQCFGLGTLEELEVIFPDMPKMYLCKAQGNLDQGYQADFVDIIAPQDFMMTEGNVKRAHDAGKEFCSWPIDSEEWIKKAIDLGVDCYFTDNVERAIGIEKEYGAKKRRDRE